jgi:hypothetical protein
VPTLFCLRVSIHVSVCLSLPRPPPPLPPPLPLCLSPTTISRSPDQEAIARLVLALRHVYQMSLQSLLGFFYFFNSYL